MTRSVNKKASYSFERQSLRREILKYLHHRRVLIFICSLVVLECMCVMAELMVDLHGIRVRFENEEKQIQNFVTFMKSKHPGLYSELDGNSLSDVLAFLQETTILWDQKDHAKCECPTNISVNDKTAQFQKRSRRRKRRLKGYSNSNKLFYGTKRVLNLRHQKGSIKKDKLIETTDGSFRNLNKHLTHVLKTPTDRAIRPLKERRPNVRQARQAVSQIRTANSTKENAMKNHIIERSVKCNEIVHMLSSIDGTRKNTFEYHIKEDRVKNKETIEVLYPTNPAGQNAVKHPIKEDSDKTKTPLQTFDRTNPNDENKEIHISNEFKDMVKGIDVLTVNTTEKASIVQEAYDLKAIRDYTENSVRADNGDNQYKDLHYTAYVMSTSNEDHNGKVVRTKRFVGVPDVSSVPDLFVFSVSTDVDNYYLLTEFIPSRDRNTTRSIPRDIRTIRSEYEKYQNISATITYVGFAIFSLMLLEIVVKIGCLGLTFFKKKIDVFDAFIVVVSFGLDAVFLDSKWSETGKGATTILLLLLPWRVVRIVNSFLMTLNHKHHIEIINVRRAKKKCESKISKLKELVLALRRDVDLLVNLCKLKGASRTEIAACIYGKGRCTATLAAITSFASVMFISSFGMGADPENHVIDDLYGNIIRDIISDDEDEETDTEQRTTNILIEKDEDDIEDDLDSGKIYTVTKSLRQPGTRQRSQSLKFATSRKATAPRRHISCGQGKQVCSYVNDGYVTNDELKRVPIPSHKTKSVVTGLPSLKEDRSKTRSTNDLMANRADPDQTAPVGAGSSGSSLFAEALLTRKGLKKADYLMKFTRTWE